MLKLTPCRIREYQSCPFQFKLLYLDIRGPKNPNASPALSFGCSVHAALDELHRPGTHSRPFDPQALPRRNWHRDGYAGPEQEAEYFKKGIQALAAYGEHMVVPAGRILGTEVFLSRQITLAGRHFELACKADRLELLPDGTLEVLDYKTNSDGQVPSPEMLAVDLPTFVYYGLARVSYPSHPRVVVSQLNVLTLAKTLVHYTAEQIADNKLALSAVVEEIEAGRLDPRPNGQCAWCSVKSYCSLSGPEVALDELN